MATSSSSGITASASARSSVALMASKSPEMAYSSANISSCPMGLCGAMREVQLHTKVSQPSFRSMAYCSATGSSIIP